MRTNSENLEAKSENSTTVLLDLKGVTMVYNTQNYWGFGLCPSSRILKTKTTTFRKLDLFRSSGEGETPTLLGPLERANHNHWTIHVIFTTAI
jgi:hypothetical protein